MQFCWLALWTLITPKEFLMLEVCSLAFDCALLVVKADPNKAFALPYALGLAVTMLKSFNLMLETKVIIPKAIIIFFNIFPYYSKLTHFS